MCTIYSNDIRQKKAKNIILDKKRWSCIANCFNSMFKMTEISFKKAM